MKTGFIHIYTGDGKGKTTSSMGLALRALGAGLNVCFCQFVKNGEYSEIRALKNIKEKLYPKQFRLHQFGIKRKVLSPFTHQDKQAAMEGLTRVEEILESGQFDLMILDECNIAVHSELIAEENILNLLRKKPPGTELVITGRYAPQSLIDAADLVTEMRNVKHYSASGVPARKGIEH